MNIINATYLKDYILLIAFGNGELMEVDLHDYIVSSKQPMTRKFLDVTKFQKFELIGNGGISWNWEMDLDGDWLYKYAQHHKMIFAH